MTTLRIGKDSHGYDINIGAGLLDYADKYFNLERRTFIVTDSGVPREYAEKILSFAKDGMIYTVPEGEGAKSVEVWAKALSAMLDFGLTRHDCAVAVGGGVVGDLTGFLAATYMRGIDFYNVPTTVLSQVDSSIGGKTAINLGMVKNSVGAFYRPRGVLIDINTQKTLPKRQISSGLSEAVKMSLTSNPELFRYFEENEITPCNMEFVITEALKIKAAVVEFDEHEKGLRKILNFGHTLGHGIESCEGLSGLFHGECVALGMIPFCSEAVRARLLPVLDKLGLPTKWGGDINAALKFALHDKKSAEDMIDVILVNTVGGYEIKRITHGELRELAESVPLK